MRAIRQIIRYVKGILHRGLRYVWSEGELRAPSDADFAGYVETRQSTRGCLTFLGSCLISWQYRCIETVVTSTCAAEYISASVASEEIHWLREIVSEIFRRKLGPTRLQVDNRAAIEVARKSAKPNGRSTFSTVSSHQGQHRKHTD